MTRDEIEQFLEDWDIAPIRNNIDMIEELIADTWQEGYEEGYEAGYEEGYEEGQEALEQQEKMEKLRGDNQ